MSDGKAYGLKGPFDLFRLDGRIRRGELLVLGAILGLVKYGIDVAIAQAFGEPWNPLMYLSPRVSPLVTGADRRFVAALAVSALPFVWMGVSLCARRLRDAGLSPFWAGVFFAPFVRYAFFLALAFLPSEAAKAASSPDGGPFREGAPPPQLPPPRLLAVLVPRRTPAAYALALVIAAVLGLVSYVLTVQVDKSFGAAFFIGLPFGLGLLVAFFTSYHTSIKRRTAIMNGISVHGILLLLLCAFAGEGVACIVMVAPLIAGMSALGGALGWSLARSARGDVAATLVLLLIPGLVGFDLQSAHEPVPMSVVSKIVVRAPIETVWKNVISFPPIDEPPAAVFALVAMPVEARIEGEGAGALRRCIFTNGAFEAFEEPIAVWRPPHELTFHVRRQPRSIEDYIDVTKGQFRLTDNGDGTTTLEGETFYSMKLRPVRYFGAWGQTLLHAIHMRVLTHIAALSEDPHHTEHAVSALPPWMESSHRSCRCTRRTQ
jgi:uncharacterized membrane protein YhaH (DUF805 family)